MNVSRLGAGSWFEAFFGICLRRCATPSRSDGAKNYLYVFVVDG